VAYCKFFFFKFWDNLLSFERVLVWLPCVIYVVINDTFYFLQENTYSFLKTNRGAAAQLSSQDAGSMILFSLLELCCRKLLIAGTDFLYLLTALLSTDLPVGS